MTTNSAGAPPGETFDYEAYQDHLYLVRTFGPTALFMDRVIRKVARPLRGLRVLDLGCGTGHLSLLMEQHNTVVSYDPALQGVRTTRARRKTRGGCIVGGGEQLPFRDELLRVFAPCMPEVLFDYGFPFMRLYLNLLARVHDAVVPQAEPTGLKRLGLSLLSRILIAVFSLDLLFAGNFHGVEIVALLRKPGSARE